ncbi:MAG: hypothetical protein IJK97_01835 [Thermoguttaceae bacterium]|nr:hypothetical protein [Thermoguttaceae bacterium]
MSKDQNDGFFRNYEKKWKFFQKKGLNGPFFLGVREKTQRSDRVLLAAALRFLKTLPA